MSSTAIAARSTKANARLPMPCLRLCFASCPPLPACNGLQKLLCPEQPREIRQSIPVQIDANGFRWLIRATLLATKAWCEHWRRLSVRGVRPAALIMDGLRGEVGTFISSTSSGFHSTIEDALCTCSADVPLTPFGRGQRMTKEVRKSKEVLP